ncbi:MAG: cytochrome c-type biogenesis protein CcmH [Chloroflexi bacterium]|nr:cytochrome c-type biogenesis protein CcmH [Chloroflexota bacterium]
MLAALLTLIAILALQSTPLHAQGTSPEIDDDVRTVAKKLNCPTCSGRNLADCPTETCLQWKGEIRAQLDSGKSTNEVVTYFQDRFGAGVLQEPPKAGSTLLLWLVPIGAAFILISSGMLVAQRLSKNKAATVTQPTAPAADDFTAQIEAQIKDAL